MKKNGKKKVGQLTGRLRKAAKEAAQRAASLTASPPRKVIEEMEAPFNVHGFLRTLKMANPKSAWSPWGVTEARSFLDALVDLGEMSLDTSARYWPSGKPLPPTVPLDAKTGETHFIPSPLPPTAYYSMPRPHEYRILEFECETGWASAEAVAQLNKLGEEGWGLCGGLHTTEDAQPGGHRGWFGLFAREKPTRVR